MSPAPSRGLPPYRAQLATLEKTPPTGAGWIHEVKYDGYRIGCALERGHATLFSRRGNDWTAQFPEVVDAVRALPIRSALLDGEVAAVLPDGRTSFQALQNAFSGGRRTLAYFVFDLLHLDGEDVARRPLEERKAMLEKLLGGRRDARVRYAPHVEGSGADVLREACRLGLEGIVSKRLGEPYRPGRNASWVKTKCVLRQELVIGGFTDPEGSREGIGAILAGYREAGALRFAGKVGTGFTNASARALRGRLLPLETRECPFTPRPAGWLGRNAHWVRPELVCEVAFTEWTGDGKIRHPSFQGLREDKRPEEVVRERPGASSTPRSTATPPSTATSTPTAGRTGKTRTSTSARTAKAATRTAKTPTSTRTRTSTSTRTPTSTATRTAKTAKRSRGRSPPHPDPLPRSAGARGRSAVPAGKDAQAKTTSGRGSTRPSTEVSGVRITHPDRILFPDAGLTKLDVVRYYDAVADVMVPHLAGRPLTLVHCPDGLAGECRFMKHGKVWALPAVRRISIREKTKTGEYLVVDGREALLSLAQMNVLELHTWNSTADRLEEPDRIVLDLDPGPEVRWAEVIRAARLVRDALAAVGLDGFVKTTGGAGLHVVVPLVPVRPWTECLAFSRAFAEALARHDPARFTVTYAKEGRERKILLDYLRNNRTNTSVAAFSTRARAGAPVSVPIAWDELEPRSRPDRFTARTVPRRLATLRADPWTGYERSRRPLDRARRGGVHRPAP